MGWGGGWGWAGRGSKQYSPGFFSLLWLSSGVISRDEKILSLPHRNSQPFFCFILAAGKGKPLDWKRSHNIANAADVHHYWHGCWSLWQNQHTEPALQVPQKSHCPQYYWHLLTWAWGGTAATGPVGVLAPLTNVTSRAVFPGSLGTAMACCCLGSGYRAQSDLAQCKWWWMLQSQDILFLRPSSGGIMWRESSCFLYVQASTVHISFRSGTLMDEQKKTVTFPPKRDIP